MQNFKVEYTKKYGIIIEVKFKDENEYICIAMYRNNDTGAWSEPVITTSRLVWDVKELIELGKSIVILLDGLNYFIGKGVEPKLPCWIYPSEPILPQLIGD
jgi:hypothetical protein